MRATVPPRSAGHGSSDDQPEARHISRRFIGRRPEQARLEHAVARSRDGTGQVVLVEGEAGVGKTRLLDEVIRITRARGHRVLVGGCVNLGDEAPLAPVAEALRGLAADTPRQELDSLLGSAREILAGLLPGLIDRGSQSSAAVMHSSGQDRLQSYLVDLFSRVSRESPLLLVVEDIHWADSATLGLLSLLARNLQRAPFTLLVTYRSDEADPDHRLTTFLAEIERLAHPEHLRLRRFTRAEVAEQIAAIRGPDAAAADLLEDVLARSQGNPFFTEELLVADSTGGNLPATLHEVLQARLTALSAHAQRIVHAAAVRGTESTEDELGAVTELDPPTLAEGLYELLDRKIFERRRVAGREVVAFRHVLLQAAAHEDLLPNERRRLHLGYAELLERESSVDPFRLAELARHLEAAGDVERALTAALHAGRVADDAFQPALSNEQYERAVRLAESAPSRATSSKLDMVDLLERAARAAAAVGSQRSIRHVTRAIELVDPSTDPIRAGLLYERLGRYHWFSADGEAALVAYHEALHLIPVRPPSVARARVTAGLGQLLMILARFADSTRYCEEALVNARAVGDRVLEAHATNTMGVNTAYLGDLEHGLELLWESKRIAEEAGSVDDVGRAFANLVDVLLTGGRYEEAAALGLSSFDYQLEHGLASIYGGTVLVYAAWGLHILARWPEAMAVLDKASQHRLDTHSEIHRLAVSAMIEACRGDVELAEAHLLIGRPLIANAIDTQLILPFAEAEAELALATGRPAEALHAVLEGVARSEPLVGGNIKRYGPVYAIGMRAAADVLAQTPRDTGAADEALAQAGELLKAMVDAHQQIESRHRTHLRLAEPYLALCQAEQTRIVGSPDPAAWAKAQLSLTAIGRRYLVAYARWREAEAELVLRGRTPAAEAALTEAREIAVDVGAQPLRARIEELGRRARITLGAGARGPQATRNEAARFGLTARETEVLHLLATGMTNRQIGDELFISGKTASVHVSNILAKLGVARRSEAAALAARMGLAGDGPAEAER